MAGPAHRQRGLRPAREGRLAPDDPDAGRASSGCRAIRSRNAETEDIAEPASSRPTAGTKFETAGEVDFAYSMPHVGRFRVERVPPAGLDQHGPSQAPLRRSLVRGDRPARRRAARIADEHRGLILVTGPTGSGKTTTLAAMIDYINQTKPVHIVTIEDPIEVLHKDKMALDQPARGRQRHAGLPCRAARRAAPGPRRDPDRRDARHRDRARGARGGRDRPPRHVDAAHRRRHRDREPGDRLLPAAPAEADRAWRWRERCGASSASGSSPTIDGGRVPGLEILINTGRVAERIADPDKTHEIKDVIADGAFYGMVTFDQSMLELLRHGKISVDAALKAVTSRHDFELAMQQAGLTVPVG